MDGVGGKKKAAEEKDAKEPEENGANNEESVGSREQWMLKLSGMKVGPPKGVKPAMGQTDTGGRQPGMIEKVASLRRLTRTVGVEAKKQLE